MAISKDRLVVEGDAASALREYAKLLDANKALKDQMRDLRREAKQTHAEHTDGLKAVGKELLTTVGGYVSVAAALGAVRSTAAAVNREMAETTKVARGAIRAQIGAIVMAGEAAHAPELVKWFGEMGKRHDFSPETVVAAYEGVRGAAPTISRERMKALVEAAAPAGKAGVSVPELAGVGGALAETFPGMDAKRAADLALVMQMAAGRAGKKLSGEEGRKVLGQWAASGAGSAESGLALLLAAYQGGQTGETLKVLQDALTTTERPTGVAARDRALRKLIGAGGATERLKVLGRDAALREAVFGGQAPAVSAVLARQGAAEAEIAGAEGAVERVSGLTRRVDQWRREQWIAAQEAGEQQARATGAISARAALRKAYHATRVRKGEAGLFDWLADLNLEAKLFLWGPESTAGQVLQGKELETFRRTFYGEGAGPNLESAAAELKAAAEKSRRQDADLTSIPGGE
ncbi:MAG: hypothetical protein FJ290_00845 [Planctomycetes bacterium]|nr:hypothetical protein [Planctomycetota bacterium]